MAISDERIAIWAKEISETEEGKCQNAISQVTDAVRQCFGYDVTIIHKGSHKNRTNIRADSDIDLAVVHNHYFFPGTGTLSPADKALYEARSIPAAYSFPTFKADLHTLLTEAFGATSVSRQNKCIRVRGNTSRVSADVVPAYEYIRYSTVDTVEATGIALKADRSGEIITSFPEQHYANGVAKNTATSRAFKAVVRILKNVRNDMIEKQLFSKDVMSSFFIECLAWNVSASHFANATYREDARSVALQIWSDMRDPAKANNYAEISDLKWLFRGQTRTPAQAEEFALKAWSHLAA